jgi:sulfite exporter TauE/SafE
LLTNRGMSPHPPLTESFALLGATLLLGASGSLHCALMCGPLACAAQGASSDSRERRRAAVAYHLARFAGYAVIGGLFGGVGRAVGATLAVSTRPVLPWLVAGLLVASVLDLGKLLARVPPIPGVTKILRWGGRARARLTGPRRAALFGAMTPLLPCGLLYGLYASALASGGVVSGAALGGAFALGAVPVLAALQLHAGLVARITRPRWVRGMVALSAAAVLVYRALQPAAGSCH